MRPIVACSILLALAACAQNKPLPDLSSVPDLATRLTPDEAYAAIPHRRTRLALGSASLGGDERRYVELAFACLDQGIALRVTTAQDFFDGERDLAAYDRSQDRLIAFFEEIDPPSGFEEYHEKVLEAFRRQKAFFAAWHAAGRVDIRTHPDVRASSHALHAAYALIQSVVGDRAPGQADALFDYHCALDFI